MAYVATEWKDGEKGKTPITAERLNNMEAGIEAGQNPAETTWGNLSGKPDTFPPEVGSKATEAAAGNHTHKMADVTDLAAALKLKATTAALEALDARVAALEP